MNLVRQARRTAANKSMRDIEIFFFGGTCDLAQSKETVTLFL